MSNILYAMLLIIITTFVNKKKHSVIFQVEHVFSN